MYRLSNNEIAIIHNKLMATSKLDNGIEPEILDHICCLIEDTLKNDETSFEQALADAIALVCPNGISEMEIEKSFLLNHKHSTMKKAVFLSGYIAATCIALGLTLKTFHWDGGWTFLLTGFGILLLYSLLWFSHSLIGFPKKPVNEKVQIVSGAGAGAIIAIGGAFKVLHYPYADILSLVGIVLLIALFFPVFFYRSYEKSVASK
jgi:hypothetical protein